MATTGDHFLFEVRACSDARLFLTSVPGELATAVVEVVIGGKSNTVTSIRDVRPGGRGVERKTREVLSCSEGRPLWVKWGDDGRVGVGLGSLSGEEGEELAALSGIAPFAVHGVTLWARGEGRPTWQYDRDAGT